MVFFPLHLRSVCIYVKWMFDEYFKSVQCPGHFCGYFLGILGCFDFLLKVCFEGVSTLFQHFFRVISGAF